MRITSSNGGNGNSTNHRPYSARLPIELLAEMCAFIPAMKRASDAIDLMASMAEWMRHHDSDWESRYGRRPPPPPSAPPASQGRAHLLCVSAAIRANLIGRFRKELSVYRPLVEYIRAKKGTKRWLMFTIVVVNPNGGAGENLIECWLREVKKPHGYSRMEHNARKIFRKERCLVWSDRLGIAILPKISVNYFLPQFKWQYKGMHVYGDWRSNPNFIQLLSQLVPLLGRYQLAMPRPKFEKKWSESKNASVLVNPLEHIAGRQFLSNLLNSGGHQQKQLVHMLDLSEQWESLEVLQCTLDAISVPNVNSNYLRVHKSGWLHVEGAIVALVKWLNSHHGKSAKEQPQRDGTMMDAAEQNEELVPMPPNADEELMTMPPSVDEELMTMPPRKLRIALEDDKDAQETVDLIKQLTEEFRCSGQAVKYAVCLEMPTHWTIEPKEVVNTKTNEILRIVAIDEGADPHYPQFACGLIVRMPRDECWPGNDKAEAAITKKKQHQMEDGVKDNDGINEGVDGAIHHDEGENIANNGGSHWWWQFDIGHDREQCCKVQLVDGARD